AACCAPTARSPRRPRASGCAAAASTARRCTPCSSTCCRGSPTTCCRSSTAPTSRPPANENERPHEGGPTTMPAPEALVFDAIRPPRGKGKVNGALHTVKPVDLVVGLMHETLVRNERLDPKRVDDVVLGCVSPIGDQGADIAKTAAIKA